MNPGAEAITDSPGVRGDNLWVGVSNCLTNTASYNVRTLKDEDRLIKFENAIEYANWDIIGLSEVR